MKSSSFYVLVLLIITPITYSTNTLRRLRPDCNVCSELKQSYDEMNSNQGQTQSLPIVDIFFMASTIMGHHYINSNQFWVIPSVARILSSNNVRLHIHTDSDEFLSFGKEVGGAYHMHDIRNKELYDSEDFYAIYKQTHHTVNQVDYEFLCFNRWHIYRSTMEEWNKIHSNATMTRIMAIDLDIMMLMDPAIFFDNVLRTVTLNYDVIEPEDAIDRDDYYEMILISLGSVQLFSRRGLVAFSEYLKSYYNRSIDTIIAANNRYGRFWSDMMLTAEFIHEPNATLTSNSCFEYWKADTFHNEWKIKPENYCLLQSIGCMMMCGYRELVLNNPMQFYYSQHGIVSNRGKLDINSTSKRLTVEEEPKPVNGTLLMKGTIDKLPYCLIHFQGKEAKILIHLYGALLQMNHVDKLFTKNSKSKSSIDIISSKDIPSSDSSSMFEVSLSSSAPTEKAMASMDSKTHKNHTVIERLCNSNVGPLLIQPSGTNEIFYISKGQRRSIWSWDSFTTHGFDSGLIQRNIPWDLVNGFEAGPPLKVEDALLFEENMGCIVI